MKKITIILLSIVVIHSSAVAQSVINKFLQQTFILNDSNKSTEGNYYAAQSYRFVKGKILMIATEGKLDISEIATAVVVKGIDENNQEIVPELKFHSDRKNKTQNIFLFTKTGNYTIYIANIRPGEKGTITNNMSLGLINWIDSGQIFKPVSKTPFALALHKIMGHAIFQFHLMMGKQDGLSYKPLVALPGADDDGKNDIWFNEEHLDKNLQPHNSTYSCDYFLGEAKFPKILQEGGYQYPEFEKNYEFKDSVSIIMQYEKYRNLLKESLGPDFTIEAEAVNKICNGKEGEFASGRMIVFKYTQPQPILDPSDAGKYSFMYQNDIRVSLSLISHTNKFESCVQAKLFLKVYSY